VVVGDEFTGGLRGNMLVLHEYTIYALSVAGHERTIQALSAGLSKGGRVSLVFERKEWLKVEPTCGYQNNYHRFPASGGFTLHKEHLGYDTWHLMAVSKEPRFLFDPCDESLWRVLHGDRFSTPLLRSWVPQLRKAMLDAGLLKRCGGLGWESYMLLATSESLDRTVIAGLKTGALVIPSDPATALATVPA
jgi:hypothetical protein